MDNGGEILRLFVPDGFGQSGQFVRFKDWLNAGSYSPKGDVTSTTFRLTAHEHSDLMGALTGEFCSCALTAYESMCEVERGPRIKGALAWPAIKAYYAGFFAAHAIMRFLGAGCSWLSASDLSRVREIAGVHNLLVSNPKKGQWSFRLDGKDILFEHCGGGSTGGAHDEVWRAFEAVLETAIEDVVSSDLISQTDRQRFLLFMSSVVREVKSGTPSNVRNGVNYRRDYGVWYPYSRIDKALASLCNRFKSWRSADTPSEFSHPDSDLCALFDFSQCLLALCLSLTKASVKYFDGRARRFSSGPMKFVALSDK